MVQPSPTILKMSDGPYEDNFYIQKEMTVAVLV